MKYRYLGVAAATFLLLAALFGAVPAFAQPDGDGCFVGRGLGATLLYPYFEADLNDFNGPATLISLNNGLDDEALVRVVLWTDWGNPTMAFDVYLPGFSVQTLNLRDTMNGGVPSTGESADLSAFDGCDVNPPFHSNPALTADEIAQLQADHTGQPGPLADNCAGSPHTDGIARGYVTVDVVDECNGVEGFAPDVTPASTTAPQYFTNGDGMGVAIDDNRLWGDVFYLSNNAASAHGSPAVALWADADAFDGPSEFTFYGRFSNWDTRDNRVPLPRAWSQRFINGGPFAGGADLLIYQDTGHGKNFEDCGSTPAEFPLDALLFATADTGDDPLDFSDSWGNFAGLATQRSSVGSLGIPYAFGWTRVDAGLSQLWVQPTLSASGVYSASLDGTAVGFLCDLMPPSESESLAGQSGESR